MKGAKRIYGFRSVKLAIYLVDSSMPRRKWIPIVFQNFARTAVERSVGKKLISSIANAYCLNLISDSQSDSFTEMRSLPSSRINLL